MVWQAVGWTLFAVCVLALLVIVAVAAPHLAAHRLPALSVVGAAAYASHCILVTSLGTFDATHTAAAPRSPARREHPGRGRWLGGGTGRRPALTRRLEVRPCCFREQWLEGTSDGGGRWG